VIASFVGLAVLSLKMEEDVFTREPPLLLHVEERHREVLLLKAAVF
jgi:hypothetical protein